MKSCPVCQTENADKNKYCINCGNALALEGEVVCEECGLIYPENWPYCPNCGSRP